jgi:hypothetical protein
VHVVRKWEIPVSRGIPNLVGVPAMMSHWGATNQQVILDANFAYSIQPDKVETVADDIGMPRRNHQFTWNAPDADTITVTQKLTIELTCRNTLATAAKLPYSKEVLGRFADQLAVGTYINGENEKVVAIGKAILKRARYAEDAVELACDWVCDNIRFKSGSPPASDTTITNLQGNCTGMANLTCAILRSMGIPAALVGGKFIRGGGHAYLEAYFPDAGWVFYDPCNATRGYKSLDCLVTTGYGFRVQSAKEAKWHEGDFLEARGATRYVDDNRIVGRPLRPKPKKNVLGVRVLHREPPASIQVRHLALNQLLMDESVPPGKREYVNPLAKATPDTPAEPATKPAAPEPAPVTVAPAPKPKPKPKPPTPEEAAKKQLQLAQVYLTNGLKSKAASILRGIVKRFPGSKQAAEAKKLLADIGKSD